MLKRGIFAIAILIALSAVPAFADNNKCRKGNFVGTYTRVDPVSDVFGDGSAVHQYVYQLTLTSDGIARQYWTGLPDFQINVGSGSESIGSWTCRGNDVIVTFIFATYTPVDVTQNPNALTPDIQLLRHTRVTVLFDITDANTLTRTQARARTYTAAQDPTNAAGGTLGNLSTTPFTYKRLVASDADLIAP